MRIIKGRYIDEVLLFARAAFFADAFAIMMDEYLWNNNNMRNSSIE